MDLQGGCGGETEKEGKEWKCAERGWMTHNVRGKGEQTADWGGFQSTQRACDSAENVPLIDVISPRGCNLSPTYLSLSPIPLSLPLYFI